MYSTVNAIITAIGFNCIHLDAEMDEFIRLIQVSRRSPKDEIFHEGDAYCLIGRIEPVYDADEEELCHKTVPTFSCDAAGCTRTFTLVYDYEQHYNSVHRYVCKECRKTLPSPHLLDIHIMETHDTYFSILSERQPMYQCFVEECTTKFTTPEERRSHCIDFHKFPPNFRYDSAKKGKSKKGQSGNKKENKDAKTVSCKEAGDIMAANEKLPASKSGICSMPKSFTFGHSQERTFVGSKLRGGKSKHWYQKKEASNGGDVKEKACSEEMPGMDELMDVLPAE
ncbi:zinc finger protein 511 [Ischnura elegans]|uniref:zinc finger protein 511 n=1 Tax=Ischnura elegans TaxID=197161 RepID=UPI001ED86999|nr:zinc finger protein 511 [Ischnura elegans]